MKKHFFFLLLLATAFSVHAQSTFFGTVKVEFEKTRNIHAYIKDADPDWYEIVKNNMPKTIITYHDFIGDSTQSIYKPGRETKTDPRYAYMAVADKNVVYNDYRQGSRISQKPVYEETFLVQDSLRQIKWRITADTRTIAGFECRKAVGILDDTIAVFAFYTDELMVSGGPESINGLPGMILGVGVPRLHTTWFATKVEVFDINMKPVLPATKGKKVTRAEMMQALDKVMRQWGTYGSKMIINFAI